MPWSVFSLTARRWVSQGRGPHQLWPCCLGLPTRLHLLQHLRRQRPLHHHYHRVGHRRNVGLLLTRKLHRSDTPGRHRTNCLEMAATSDRTLAAIGNQRAQPASLSAEQRHDEPARIGRRSTSVPVATLFRSSADARAAVLRVRSFRSRDSGSSNHLDALFQNRSDVGRWIGLWSLEAGPRHDEILTDLLRTSCIG